MLVLQSKLRRHFQFIKILFSLSNYPGALKIGFDQQASVCVVFQDGKERSPCPGTSG